MNKQRRPFQLGLRTLLLSVYGVAMLLMFGDYARERFDVGYTSQAIFQIQPNWILGDQLPESLARKLNQFGELRHDQRLLSDNSIAACLSQNNLFVLDSFLDKTKKESIQFVKENLRVEKLSETGSIYRLNLRMRNPYDCATVVNNLVKCYHDELVTKYPKIYSDYFTFTNCEVGRVGEQNQPEQKTNVVLGILVSTTLALLILFPVNIFRPCEASYSLQGALSTLLLLAVFFCMGFAITTYFSRDSAYVTNASMAIKDNIDDSKKRLRGQSRVPHDVLIGSYNHIERTLEKHNLFILEHFLDLSKEQAVRKVRRNLQIERDKTNPYLLRLTYSAGKAEDCEKLLGKLIESYIESLDRQNELSAYRLDSVSDQNVNQGQLLGRPILYQVKLMKNPSMPTVKTIYKSSLDSKVLSGWAFVVVAFVILWIVTKQRCYLLKQSELTDV